MQTLDILRGDRAIVLPLIDELELCVSRVVGDLDFEIDFVVRSSIRACRFRELGRRDETEVRLDIHESDYILYFTSA